MLAQPTTAIDYSLVQFVEYQTILTTLTKYSNSETLEPYYNKKTNIKIKTYNDDYMEDDDILKPKKRTISVVLDINKISKKIPKIDIEEFEELED